MTRLEFLKRSLEELPQGVRPSWVSCEEALLRKEIKELEKKDG